MEAERAQPDWPELRIAGLPAEDASWSRLAREALAQAPDPEQAARSAGDLLTALLAGDEGREVAAGLAEPTTARKLAALLRALCGIAPFFVRFLQRHPDWLPRLLAEDLELPRSREDLAARLDAAFAAAREEDPERVLRRFKYYELARITARDCTPDWVPLGESGVTLRELSQLADLLLDRALSLALAEVGERHGPPRWRLATDGRNVELGFCVLGLGKLGAEELNYSSDVDLIYVHQAPPGELATDPADAGREEPGAARALLMPADYFTRVAQAFGKLVADSTADGFLYRVDLDLRPEGAQGTLVVSDEALASYYEAWADTWEKAAFMKARPVAGDIRLGWQAIRRVAPSIYQSSMDIAGVESIRSMKRQVEETHGNQTLGFNVKIDAGGIRDVEFIAQALLLLHGGRIPQVRQRSTQRALRALEQVGLLEPERARDLLGAYLFLRRVENRLQMEAERQVHHVPRSPAALLRLARATGFVAADACQRFEAGLQQQRDIVLAPFATQIAERGRERILELFTRNVPHLLALASTRRLIEELADHFAHCIDDSPDPERALNNLDRFVQNIGARRFYYELLFDRPELVPRLTALFANSKFLSAYLASHPQLIEPVFADPNVLVLSKQELRADLAAAIAAGGDERIDSVEHRLDALRLFQHKQVVNVGLLDIGGKIDRAEAEQALTEIAEVCIEAALTVATEQLARRKAGVPEAARAGAYLVVGMGKLGSRELSYGSDLDLIFLFEVGDHEASSLLEAQEYFVKLTQRLISALQTHTAEGACYEIDARLRPSGNQGMLVTSVAAFQRYHDTSAEVWERQALLRARPVAGDPRLAERFEALRRDILMRPLPDTLATDIDSIRRRMESELAQETRSKHDFKTGRGGLLDVETVVQYLQLRSGADHPELLDSDRLETHLAQLESGHLIAARDAASLREGWDFLQRLANRLRVVENRSISDLDEEHGDLDSLARRLGYDSGGRAGSDRRALLRDYRHHTEAIRRVYLAILSQAG